MRLAKTRTQSPDALRFRVAHLHSARKFPLRQGLWIEDLQIPPGQECSNGSTILLAVVLWRASFARLFGSARATTAICDETSQNQNSAFFQVSRSLR